MHTVYKYPLDLVDNQEVTIQGKVLSIAVQHNSIVMYTLTDPVADPERKVAIRIVGTGNSTAAGTATYNFLGTASLLDGALMFHVFYKEVQ